MSIHDRCWQCSHARRINSNAEYGGILVCALRPPDEHYLIGNDCDKQRQSRSKKDCGAEGQFFVHRDLHKLKEQEVMSRELEQAPG